MKKYLKIVLKKGKDEALKRFHPWLFSGAIGEISGSPEEGEIVEILSSKGEYLATGHFNNSSIAVKIFSFVQREISASFWKDKIISAYELRKKAGLTDSSLTNAYRLIYSEGDDLPGLIIDWYNGTAVIQTHCQGMHNIKNDIVEILKEIYGERLKAVYDKSSSVLKIHPDTISDKLLYGDPETDLILETGHSFHVDWQNGQKTGFFLDQRNNRMFAQYYARDKKVLNAFCYSGAFSVYALKGGATMVHSVDSSHQAIQLLEKNLSINGLEPGSHQSFQSDVKDFFAKNDQKYEMIILDPPAFAKRHTITHNALQGYININTEALNRLEKNGILMTFSCSQAISKEMFQSAVFSAALQAGRNVKILHRLSQGPDHPVNIYHPEGEYLKGLILFVG